MEPSNSVAYFNRGSTYDSMGLHDQVRDITQESYATGHA